MAIRRKSVRTWVKNLKKSDDYYVYELGPKPQIAARMIQRFVKTLLFKFKIRRISRVYNLLRQQIVEEMDNKIRRYLRIFQSKAIISDMKFQVYKSNKLKQIRERVSIVSVKNFWRKSKFTFKIIMMKIKKTKRMLRNEQRIKKPSTANLSSPKPGHSHYKGDLLTIQPVPNQISSKSSLSINDFDSALSNEEGKAVKEDLESLTSEINRKLEQERQEKLSYVRLSYNLPKAKEPSNVLPYLYQKDIIEGVSPPSHYISTTRASVFRMNDSNPKRLSPRRLSLPPSLPSKPSAKPTTSSTRRPKPGGDQNPLYMKPTTASKMCRWDAGAPNEEIEEPKKFAKPREDSKVLSPTFAFIQKRNRAFTPKEMGDRPGWRPSTHYQEPARAVEEWGGKAREPKGSARPKTMSVSPRGRGEQRGKTAIWPIPETKIEINSLSFEAALPGMADILNSYGNGFVVRVKPRVDKVRQVSK